jgi:low temperature requirement protein LtrA
MLRAHAGAERATNIELFFDLVYVFAVTQLSVFLLAHATIHGALQTLVLFGMVWLAWAYTTWVTNWLDPGRLPVRSLLLVLMVASLVMSAGLPRAFTSWGLAVGCTYAGMQIGRTVFVVVALRGERLQRNFERILAWCVVSGGLAVVGGIATATPRELLWLAAVAVDVAGGLAGFYTPGLGRSRTADWTIEGNHLVAGIIVTAAADQTVLDDPSARPDAAAAVMILGGSALFVAGHAAFKFAVWRAVPATRLIAIVVLGLLGLLAPHVSAIVLGVCAGVVLIALAASDRIRPRSSPAGAGGLPDGS